MDTNSSANNTDYTSLNNPEVPKVVDIKITLVTHKPQELRYIESILTKFDKAVEIMVKMDRDIAIFGELYPTLLIGNYEITEMNLVDDRTMRFLAFNINKLRDGESILFGWYGAPKEFRKDTGFKYKLSGQMTI